jgi:hypothetical protein
MKQMPVTSPGRRSDRADERGIPIRHRGPGKTASGLSRRSFVLISAVTLAEFAWRLQYGVAAVEAKEKVSRKLR